MNDIMETDRGRVPWGVRGEKTTLKTLKYLETRRHKMTIGQPKENDIGQIQSYLEEKGRKQLGKHLNIYNRTKNLLLCFCLKICQHRQSKQLSKH